MSGKRTAKPAGDSGKAARGRSPLLAGLRDSSVYQAVLNRLRSGVGLLPGPATRDISIWANISDMIAE